MPRRSFSVLLSVSQSREDAAMQITLIVLFLLSLVVLGSHKQPARQPVRVAPGRR